METDILEAIVKKAVQEAMPKEWLSKSEVCTEFGIKSTTFHELINDAEDPLPYSTIGKKKQLVSRVDINSYLNRRKRNG